MNATGKRVWSEAIRSVDLKKTRFELAVTDGDEYVAREYYLEMRAELEQAICRIPSWRWLFKRKAVLYFENEMRNLENAFRENAWAL